MTTDAAHACVRCVPACGACLQSFIRRAHKELAGVGLLREGAKDPLEAATGGGMMKQKDVSTTALPFAHACGCSMHVCVCRVCTCVRDGTRLCACRRDVCGWWLVARGGAGGRLCWLT